MRRRGNLRNRVEQLDVLRPVVEFVIADQHAVRLAAELAVLFLINLLEDRALVPRRATELAQRAGQLALRQIEHLDLQTRPGFGGVDQEEQPAPGCFHLLELWMVQDQVGKFADLAIDLSDHRFNRPPRIR